jgi:thiol-disulfide isomerase/thioredoxin
MKIKNILFILAFIFVFFIVLKTNVLQKHDTNSIYDYLNKGKKNVVFFLEESCSNCTPLLPLIEQLAFGNLNNIQITVCYSDLKEKTLKKEFDNCNNINVIVNSKILADNKITAYPSLIIFDKNLNRKQFLQGYNVVRNACKKMIKASSQKHNYDFINTNNIVIFVNNDCGHCMELLNKLKTIKNTYLISIVNCTDDSNGQNQDIYKIFRKFDNVYTLSIKESFYNFGINEFPSAVYYSKFGVSKIFNVKTEDINYFLKEAENGKIIAVK